MTGVFVSYSRKDGEDFARDIRAVLEDNSIEVFQDRIGLEGGRDWWLQLTQAIDQAEFMVLVATPKAMQSDIVRKEWRYARQQGVCVYPVMHTENPPDFASLPKWMRDANFYEFDHAEERQRLLNDLQTRCEAQRVPFMADPLPADFVPRLREFNALKRQLLDSERGEPIAITAALRGAGGFGKTTLARALCHDEDIQTAFDDGILWVTLGESVDNRIDKVLDLITVLTGDRPQISELETAKTRLNEVLADRDILLVIDDVWSSADLKPFLDVGKSCARLITTRNDDVLPSDAQRVAVDAMQRAEGIALLQHGIEEQAEQRFADLAERLGYWALLLKLANGALRKRIQAGNDLTGALDYVQRVLDKRGLAGFDSRNEEDRHAAVASCLQISFEQLESDELERFQALAIFPEDTDIPLTTVAQLWGVDDLDTEDTCLHLMRLSLLLDFDLQSYTLRLHDVIRDYLRRQVDLPTLNQQLLEAWGYNSPLPSVGEGLGVRAHPLVGEGLGVRAHPPVGEGLGVRAPGEGLGVPDLPDTYAWQHIAYHLSEADRAADLRQLLLDFDWLQAKLHATDALQLLADFDYAPEDDTLRLIRSAVEMSVHVLLEDKNSLAHQLTGRLNIHRANRDIGDFLKDTQSKSECLVPLNTTHMSAGGHLLRTLSGHTNDVNGALVLADGRILSWSSDNTLRLWSAAGEALATLEGHTREVRGALVLADGRILSWEGAFGEPGTLRLWSSDGAALATMEGHTRSVNGALQLDDDGGAQGRLLSWSDDNTLRLWSSDGEALATLEGHTWGVNGALVLVDGRILSWSGDDTLRLWSEAGEALATLEGHPARVNGALQLDAQGGAHGRLLSWSSDGTLRLWSVAGEALATLEGHTDSVNGALQLADGRILSWDGDRLAKAATLRLWSSDGAALATLEGHTWGVNGALQLDAQGGAHGRLLSWSFDGTLRLWSEAGEALAALEGHTAMVNGALQLDADGGAQGRVLSWSSDHTLRLWSVEGEALATLEGHTAMVNGVLQLDAQGGAHGRLLSWSSDHTLRLWSPDGEALAPLKGHTNSVLGALQLADGGAHGRILSWSLDNTLRLWSVEGEALAPLKGHTNSVLGALQLADGGAHGRILSWSFDGTLRLWSVEGEALATLAGHRRGVNGALQLGAHGRMLSWSDDNTLRLWSAYGEALATLEGHTRSVRGALQLDDGRILSWDGAYREPGTLRLWSVAGEALATLDGHRSYVRGALQLADGRILSWDGDRLAKAATLRLWSVEGEALATLDGHRSYVLGALQLADGGAHGRLLSWSDDNTLRLWSADGEALATLEGHRYGVQGALQLADGGAQGRVLSWSRDNTLRLWSVDGEALASLEGHRHRVNGTLQLADGRILSWDGDRLGKAATLRLWSSEGEPLSTLYLDARPTRCIALSDGHTIVVGDEVGRVMFFRLPAP